MPLPETVCGVFELAKETRETDESQFYGPYNVLLNYLSPHEERHAVVPQYKRLTQSRSVDFTTIFFVRHKMHPVFFVEDKSSGALCHISSRQEADLQMRGMFTHLFEDVVIGTLYGASAMRTTVLGLDGGPYRMRHVCLGTAGDCRGLPVIVRDGGGLHE